MKGYLEKTYLRGTLICENGQMKVAPGFGKFYPMIMDAE